MRQPVQFFYNEVSFPFVQRNRLKSFLAQLVGSESRKTLDNLVYIFCTDAYLLEINRQFLAHDEYTDIVTFDLAADKQTITGEIYISIDRVKENAVTHNVRFESELHRVIFHGVLHLCGYKDKTTKEVKLMRAMEEQYLSLYFDN